MALVRRSPLSGQRLDDRQHRGGRAAADHAVQGEVAVGGNPSGGRLPLLVGLVGHRERHDAVRRLAEIGELDSLRQHREPRPPR